MTNTMLIENPIAVYKALWRYLNRDTDSPDPFGWDWNTLYMLFPHIATTMAECQRRMSEECNAEIESAYGDSKTQ